MVKLLPIKLRRLRDAGALTVFLLVRCLYCKEYTRPQRIPEMDQLPSWWSWYGTQSDWINFGYDAQQWLYQATTFFSSEQALPFPARPPLWPLGTATLGTLLGDMIFAGHVLNDLLFTLTGVMIYLLGKRMGGRLVGLLAALLVIYAPPLLRHVGFFGIDAGLYFFAAAGPLCCWTGLTSRRWAATRSWLVISLAWLTHVLMGLFCLGTYVLLLLSWRRWTLRQAAAFLLVPLGAWVAIKLFVVATGTGGWENLNNLFNYTATALEARFTMETGRVEQSTLMNMLVEVWRIPFKIFSPSLFPLKMFPSSWMMVLVSGMWFLGVLGFGLAPGAVKSWRPDLRGGIWLLALQAPLFLATLDEVSPQRYAFIGLPFYLLTLSRGVISVGLALEAALRRKVARLPAGPAQVALLSLLVLYLYPGWQEHRYSHSFSPDHLQNHLNLRDAARTVSRTFGEGRFLISPEVDSPLVHSGRSLCMPHACEDSGEGGWKRCAGAILRECLDKPNQGERAGVEPALPCLIYRPGTVHKEGEKPPPPVFGDVAGMVEAIRLMLVREVAGNLPPVKEWTIQGGRLGLYAVKKSWLQAAAGRRP